MVGHSVAQQPQPVSGIATKLSRFPDFLTFPHVCGNLSNRQLEMFYFFSNTSKALKKSAGKREEIKKNAFVMLQTKLSFYIHLDGVLVVAVDAFVSVL